MNTEEKEKIIKFIISEKFPFTLSELFLTYLEKSPMFKITIEKKANNVPVILMIARIFSLDIRFF